MGSQASSSEVPQSSSQPVTLHGSSLQRELRDLATRHPEEDTKDLYELFGLERYVEIDENVERRVKLVYRRLSLKCHPDKNEASDSVFCEGMQTKLNLAKTVLLTPDLKRRYDIELRKTYGEGDVFSTVKWYAAWGFTAAAVAGALTAVVLGCPFVAAPAFGCAASVAIKMVNDPDCSCVELLKDAVSGGVAGLAAGAVGIGVPATSIAGCALVGAGATLSGTVALDVCDLVVAEGHLGGYVNDNVSDARGREEIFSLQNITTKACQCTVGAAIGGLIPVHTASGNRVSEASRVVARAAIGTGIRVAPQIVQSLSGNSNALKHNGEENHLLQLSGEGHRHPTSLDLDLSDLKQVGSSQPSSSACLQHAPASNEEPDAHKVVSHSQTDLWLTCALASIECQRLTSRLLVGPVH